jgi:cardiolipin synthase
MSQRARAPGRPRPWRDGSVPRRWRYRLAPEPLKRAPKGFVSLWTRARRLLWSWWPWALGALWAAQTHQWGWAAGLAAVALLAFLATPTEFPPRYGLDHEFAIESEEFLSTIAGATGVPFSGGNRIAILNNGDSFYPAMLEEVARARASITIEAYIYWAGEVGLQFAQALAGRAKQGVRVKILLDAVGSSRIGEDILKTLETGGCQLAWYNPIRWYTLARFNHRTHRKSLIVDGRVAFTGGAGIADHWRGNAQDADHWRDIQIRVEGPAVTPLQTGFAQNWLECTGELVSGELYYPLQPHTPGRLAVQTIMSSPETGASTARIMYCLSIISARRSIFIANPYFVPDQVAIDTLVEARRRGVDVKVMVAGPRNDSQLARQNSVRLYGPLLRAGVEILEYVKTMLHHKTMVVDELWGTVGTTNFDNRSFAHNEESNVCFYDRALARELHETFLADARECRRVSLEAWQRRGAWRKTVELAASFFRDQV